MFRLPLEENTRMPQTVAFDPGAYRFVPAAFQYSAGVVAMPGHRIVRVQFQHAVPLAEGFARAEALIKAADRPLTAFCACELRSPAPFSEAGFQEFNKRYVGTLNRWGIFDGAMNPVARSNVCPEANPPGEPSLYAFAYTEPSLGAAPNFVVAGSGEVPEGKSSYREHVVRYGDVSPEGLREKARFVLTELERRLELLGFGWHHTTATQVYTVHDIHPFLADEIVRRGAARFGLTWHYDRPPVNGLDYEMDCRAVALEIHG
jgi:hypothetical protein